MELGQQVSLDAAQEESCLTGTQAALLVALSGAWELMNSIFIAFVWDPALPPLP